MKSVVGDDQTVPGAEAVRHVAGEVQSLLDEDDRVFTDLLRRLVLLHDEIDIGIGAFLHLIGIVVRCRAAAPHMESALQLVFTQSVRRGAFSGGF